MTDKERFSEICSRVINTGHPREGIGTYGEKSVHYALKMFFEENEECREVRVGKYIADIKNGSEITEIQSSGFGALKGKLGAYLCSDEITRINIVHPIIEKKKVTKISPATGEIVREYASPRHVRPADIFKELLFLGDGMYSPKVNLILVSLAVDEVSFDTAEIRKRRGTTSKIDKIPREILDIKKYSSVYDMGDLFSFNDGETVTTAQIRKYLRATGRNGWAAIRIMEEIGFLKRSGKDGNKILYTFNKHPENKTNIKRSLPG